MATSRQASFYKKHLNCPICMEMFTDPRALPCLHTFCSKCLHSYIMSVNALCEYPSDGFECPVCRTYTVAPLHGLHPYSWAENYPPDFTVRALIEDAVNTTSQVHVENISANVQQIILDDRQLSVDKEQNVCQSHPDRRIEFFCENHKQFICSMCAAVEHKICERVNCLQEKIKEEKATGLPASESTSRRHHRALFRLGRSSSSKEEEFPDPPPINPVVLTQEFAAARAIDSSEKKEDPIAWTQPKPLLKRLYGDDKEKRNSVEESHLPPSITTEVDSSLSETGVKPMPNSEQPSNGAEQRISDDLRDFLNIHLPQQHVQRPGNPVGHLNDIKEEDEDPRRVDAVQSVPRFHDKIYVRIQSDSRCCSITGITTLPDNRVLVADENNRNIKLFDSDGGYLNHLVLPSEPFDVDNIEQFEAVVSFPSEKCIRVLIVSDALSILRTIDFEKRCQGVVYHENEFLVALENEIRVLSYEGDTLSRFHRDPSKRKIFTSGKPIFTNACYLAVDNQYVHVSESRKNIVMTLNKKGKVISTFRDGEFVKMLGLSPGPAGKLFVCQWPSTLYLLSISEYGCHIRNVLSLDNIQAVHFDLAVQKLWVTQATNNFINLFSFKPNHFT